MKDLDLNQIKTWRDAKSAGAPAFKIMSDGVIKAYKDADGVRRFSLTASSDDTDLVGDVMTEKALKRMESAAPGTTMFLNHSYSVPEDVFGAVESAAVEKKTLKSIETGKDSPMLCLEYQGVVEENNDRAVKVHDMMMAGRVKLGASVSVLVTARAKDARNRIDDVYYLECSVVGMPCNRQSWVDSASKALDLDALIDPTQTTSAESAPAAPPAEVKEKFLEIAKRRFLERAADKGIFLDELSERTDNIWFLTSVMCGAYFDLYWNVRAGVTAADEIEGLLSTGLGEFASEVIARLLPKLQEAAAEAQGVDVLDEIGYYAANPFLMGDLASIKLFPSIKAGKRNSDKDQTTIQSIHDYCLELGADCKSIDDEDDDSDEDEDPDEESDKGLSVANKALTSQVAELEGTVKSLTEELAKAAERLSAWEASTPVIQKALRLAGREHLTN